MPFLHVIAFAKTAAQSAQNAADAGGRLNAPGAAAAARRAADAAHATYRHALVDLEYVWDDPTSTLNGTARRLSELATDAAWAAKAVAQALAHEDSVVAREAVCDAHEAAVAALTATDAAELQVTDPKSELGREAAQQAMEHATAQAEVEMHGRGGLRMPARGERGDGFRSGRLWRGVMGGHQRQVIMIPRRGRARFLL